jgi:hypothetical protein
MSNHRRELVRRACDVAADEAIRLSGDATGVAARPDGSYTQDELARIDAHLATLPPPPPPPQE